MKAPYLRYVQAQKPPNDCPRMLHFPPSGTSTWRICLRASEESRETPVVSVQSQARRQ